MKEPIDEFMCFYGVGNRGGGPTIAHIESIHRLDDDPKFPAHLVFSTLEAFFQAAETKSWPIPIVQSELQHHASGCYAAHSGIKHWNRLAENRLPAAEKLSVVAAVCVRLGINGMRVRKEIQPELPSYISLNDPLRILVLKSGSFGKRTSLSEHWSI
jgi:alpha-mannosidase